MTDEPLDLDAILTRANLATGGHLDEAFISADEDVPALIDEVRRLRAELAQAERDLDAEIVASLVDPS